MRTAITSSTGITLQKGRGLWKVCCGKHQAQDGTLKPTIHWLGRDPEHAAYVAFTIRKHWRAIQGSGGDHWLPEDLARVKLLIIGGRQLLTEAMQRIDRQRRELDEQEQFLKAQAMFAMPNLPALPAAITPQNQDRSAPSLYSAIKAYLDSLMHRNVSDAHRDRAAQILNGNLKAVRSDCPLANVDYAWLESLANYFKGRPAKRKDKDRKISANTAALIMRYLRAFFIWLDDASWNGWNGPPKLPRLFRCTAVDLMTPVELKEPRTIAQFDLATLARLYAAADDFARRCMLMALFTGATQVELSVLEKCEFDLDAGTLHHFRNKTGVEGQFWLPPELVKMLRADFATRPKDTLAFRRDGERLLIYRDGCKTFDAVRQAWDETRGRANLPDALSFKYLRKYLANWMLRMGGEEMGQIALSHTRKTVLARHYSSAIPFEKFQVLQRNMYHELMAGSQDHAGVAEWSLSARRCFILA